MNTNTEVVIIDDNIPANGPYMKSLRMENSVVTLFDNPQDGLDYVQGNLHRRLVVVLDIMFGAGAISGNEVFQRIREHTHLIPVIICSAGLTSNNGVATVAKNSQPHLQEATGVTIADLVKFLNEHAFAYMGKPVSFIELGKVIQRAVKSIEARVDSALEDWILKHPKQMREKPYLMTASGESLKLDDILIEVRKQTPKGKQFEKQLLNLTIDLLMRGKKEL
jgi:DNA-binding NtrC family response regulator